MNDPIRPIKNGLYAQSFFSLYKHHTEYVSRRQQSGIRNVLIEVTVTPKAARFEAMVFEYIVKHWPFAQRVVVV